jgi:Holliday junction DNA helicase RuvA
LIAQLRGRLVSKTPGEVVLDVGGVGYRVAIPVSTFYRLREAGSEASLLTYTHVREDVLALFGFGTHDEQALFELLISVSGVGPKLALNVLSGIEAPELVQALRVGDIARLTRIPGVGKKTAERLVVDLRDRASKLHVASLEPAEAPAVASSRDDLASALANLGYSRPEAEKAVERALKEDGAGRFEDLLRRALRILSGR